MSTYPVHLTALDEQRALVIGTGPAAERKIERLLEAGADVTVIDPDPASFAAAWAKAGTVSLVERAYRKGDVEGVALIIVTEANNETKEQIWKEAQERNVLINTAGNPSYSTFANGATVRRGPLVVSVSTSGAAPALSVRIREQLEKKFGPEYESFVAILKALRDPMKAEISTFDERRDRWYQLVDSNVLDLLQGGRRGDAWARIEAIVGPAVMHRMEAEDGCMGA